MKIRERESERHVLTITVDNEAGILAKIAGLFTARGYNIDSLTVADISENHSLSRITIVTHGPPAVIDQIRAQLERLVPVHKVVDLTELGAHVERELALVKVSGKGEHRVEALRLAEVFRARPVATSRTGRTRSSSTAKWTSAIRAATASTAASGGWRRRTARSIARRT